MRTLRELREATGLTGGQLASMIAVTAGTLASWERGHGRPNTRQVGQLALALGVTPAGVLAVLLPPPKGRP
jgi:transcriptional regulator with XRE-family HTH domain